MCIFLGFSWDTRTNGHTEIHYRALTSNYNIDILKSLVKMTDYSPKMVKDATFVRTLNGHYSVIFHRDKSNTVRTLALASSVNVFWAFFVPMPHMGKIRSMDQKPSSRCWFMSLPSPSTHSSTHCSKNFGREPPPPSMPIFEKASILQI